MRRRLYTWYDVEITLRERSDVWATRWVGIEVTTDELTVLMAGKPSTEAEEDAWAKLQQVFGPRVDRSRGVLLLDGIPEQDRMMFISIRFAEGLQPRKRYGAPLFAAAGLEPAPPPVPPAGAPPILAFYSFKGGVGRTLTLLGVARALSMEPPAGRLLLVDADWEAPGLTWLARLQGAFRDFSYLDALALIHSVDDWRRDALPLVVAKVREELIRLPVGGRVEEHFFLPAFRYDQQVLDVPVRSHQLTRVQDRQYVVGDFLFELGKALAVRAVLVDLRAGISEAAAPLLLDPRIQPVIVTSTSEQSVSGTEVVLRELSNRWRGTRADVSQPLLLISQVPHDLSRETVAQIRDRLLRAGNWQQAESDTTVNWVPADGSVVELPFESGLIHLEDLADIDRKLSPTETQQRLREVFADLLPVQRNPSVASAQERQRLLQTLQDRCRRLVYAEQGEPVELFPTRPLRTLAQKFRAEPPLAVVMGAKGAGKTFTFLQLVRKQHWEGFVADVLREPAEDLLPNRRLVFPLVIPRSLAPEAARQVEEAGNATLAVLDRPATFRWRAIGDAIVAAKDTLGENELFWRRFWTEQMASALGIPVSGAEDPLQTLHRHLEQGAQQVVFLVDGLEDYFQYVHSDRTEQVAVRALCQGVVERLQEMPRRHIGLVVFMRRDIAEASIPHNFGQFASLYESFELRWGFDEALRLILWVALLSGVPLQALPDEVSGLSVDEVKRKLEPLWGRRMGPDTAHEAYTHRWVLAALSNFEGRLQARDVIRFIQHAAAMSQEIRTVEQGYRADRFLQVPAIKRAIRPCGEEKVREIGEEIPALRAVFDKIRSAPPARRRVPFQREDFDLTVEDIRLLKEQHILTEDEAGLFMPEIYRQGLELKTAWASRPRVVQYMQRLLAQV